MAEYIKRDDAIDKIIECVGEDEADFLEGVLHLVPTADVVERKHGKWENTLQGWKCSACHKEQDYSVFFNFCPNCGARMDSEGNDG